MERVRDPMPLLGGRHTCRDRVWFPLTNCTFVPSFTEIWACKASAWSTMNCIHPTWAHTSWTRWATVTMASHRPTWWSMARGTAWPRDRAWHWEQGNQAWSVEGRACSVDQRRRRRRATQACSSRATCTRTALPSNHRTITVAAANIRRSCPAPSWMACPKVKHSCATSTKTIFPILVEVPDWASTSASTSSRINAGIVPRSMTTQCSVMFSILVSIRYDWSLN